MRTKLNRIYWVDLPNPQRTSDDDSFVNVRSFPKKREAIKFLWETYGMPTRVASFFITCGEELCSHASS